MSPLRTVLLIGSREVRQRLRSRLFVGTTLGIAVLLTVAAALPALFGVFDPPVPPTVPDLDEPEPVALGVVGELSEEERQAVEGAVGAVDLRRIEDLEAAELALREEEVDIVVLPGDRLLVPPSDGILRFGSPEAGRVAEALALAELLPDDPGRVADVLDLEPLAVEEVGDEDPAETAARLVIANLAVVFLFGVLVMYSSMIINGVIEEKGSRVVELLVETVPVRQLMAGKVLGLGAIGLGQTIVLFGPPLAVFAVTARASIPPGVAGLGAVVVLWFVLGYGLYAVMAAALGSLVSRPEEAQAVLTPANLLMIAGYFIGFVAINAPDALFARVAALVPFSAPYVMLVRQALAEPSLLEVAAAVAFTLVTIAALTAVAARVYEGGILRVGARVKLRDAWRSDGL